MSNYLLLRDNKQSGPYSVDELKNKGLKAYDLVWLDGKSAAWRYPSEVEELKPFAPVVEEQPFDRFYKKPSQETNTTTTTSLISTIPTIGTTTATATTADSQVSSASAPAVSPVSAEPSPAPSTGTTAGRRIIYVTMPVGTMPKPATAAATPMPPIPVHTSSVPAPLVPTSLVPTSPVPTSPVPQSNYSAQPESVTGNTGTPPESRRPQDFREAKRSLKPAIGEEEFSQGAALSDPYFVEKRPQYNRDVSGRMRRSLILSLGVIALLAAGVFIGLSINGHLRNAYQSAASGTEGTPEKNGNTANTPVPVYTTAVNNPASKSSENNLSPAVVSDPTPSGNVKTTGEASGKKKTTTTKGKTVLTGSQKSTSEATVASKDSVLSLLAQAGRETPRRSDELPDKESIKNAVVSQVSISTNKYNTGTFGGISELQLTVSNRSVYPLDLVVVEVQYIQSNKKVYKTENLYFRGIGAGAALMQEAPKSSRGIKVQSRIILINSKELGLSYSGI